MEEYITKRKPLKRLYVVIDARHGKNINILHVSLLLYLIFMHLFNFYMIIYIGLKLPDHEFLQMLEK